MEFLKKHWDKILLTLSLLGLMVSAVYLALNMEKLNKAGKAPFWRQPRGEALAPINQQPYRDALARLENPLLWTNLPQDPFGQTEAPTVNTTVVTNPPSASETVFLRAVTSIPFKLIFKAYTGDGQNFQINSRDRNLTFTVEAVGYPVSTREYDTGYKAVKFEKKFEVVSDPSIGGVRSNDVSVLTLQRGADRPILLVLGQEAEEEDPVALVRCDPGWPGKPRDFRVRRNQEFSCAGRSYIVLAISKRQMIISDQQTKEKLTVNLTGTRD